MKNLIIALLLISCSVSYAQNHKQEIESLKKEMRQNRGDLSPEQMAELSTKKLTLRLDLTETQQKEIHKVELEQAKLRKERSENKTDAESVSKSERFEMKTKRLDNQIAFKKKMKSILTEEQYARWEKIKHSKQKGRKGKHKKGGDRSDRQ